MSAHASGNQGPGTAGAKVASAEDPLIAEALRQAEATPVSGEPSSSLPFEPDMFPGYQVIREIHRGGQGVVYQAIQKNTKRKVAIKVMREGPFSGPKDRARFEREVEILASLNHPNIVTVQDSGEVAGTFYYVMDYISGESLEQFLASSKPTLEETLAVFAKVCDAVNAAHLKGVIHRDLKPGNVRIDSSGEPHILDFGLAKTATSDIMGHSTPAVMTVTGQFIGSLYWASPEQAEGNPEKIDVRTDVYSLGVMLYHALTGRFPYQVIGNMRDVLDNILKAAPVRPSTVRRKINDEVETIVLKCLAKERERRYQTAGELARDLRNYLSGQPIEAKRDSGWYILRTTLRRYKGPAAAVAAVALAVTAGGATSTVLWRHAVAQREAAEAATERAEIEKEAAEAARVQAEAAKGRESAARAQAEDDERRAAAYAAFLDLTLTSIDPDFAKGMDRSLMEAVLERGVAQVAGKFPDDPDIEAQILDTIGRTYTRLGRADKAQAHLTRAVELLRQARPPRPAALARCLCGVARLRWLQGDFAGAKAAAEEAVRVASPGPGEPAPPPSPDQAERHLLLGLAAKGMKDTAAARAQYDRAIEIATAAGDAGAMILAEALSSLGRLQMEGGDGGGAEASYRRALELVMRIWGEESIEAAVVKGNLGSFLRGRNQPGDLDRAEQVLREVVANNTRILPPEHGLIANALNKLGLTLLLKGEHAEANEALSEALRIARTDKHQSADLAAILKNLGAVKLAQNDAAGAEPLLLESFGLLRARGGVIDENTKKVAASLAEVYKALGDAAKEAEYRAVAEGR